MGRVTVYRSATLAWGTRSATVIVDGADAGRLRAKLQLTLELKPGPHTFSARIGHTTAPTLPLDVDESAPTIVAIRAAAPDRTLGIGPLNLAVVADFDDRGVSLRDLRQAQPPRGYRRRSRREQLLWAVGLVLLFGGQLIAHLVNRLLGVSLALVGAAIVLVIGFRLFIYREDMKPPDT